MIPLEGDIKLYVFDLAVIVFTGIKHTAEWFLEAFKENENAARELSFMSYCWLKERLPWNRLCTVEQRTDGELLRYV